MLCQQCRITVIIFLVWANLCRWLAEQAEAMGVDIFPGFPAAEVISKDGKVAGVITGDMGVDAENGDKKIHFNLVWK